KFGGTDALWDSVRHSDPTLLRSREVPLKTIATINFKGGVGKTTATWALGQIASGDPTTNSLMFDLDAQMSLTQAIALNEDGSPLKDFSDWYERSVGKKKTIFNALDEYTK